MCCQDAWWREAKQTALEATELDLDASNARIAALEIQLSRLHMIDAVQVYTFGAIHKHMGSAKPDQGACTNHAASSVNSLI